MTINFKMWQSLFYVSSPYCFQQLFSLKLGHKFSQFIHRFKIWIFKCSSWDVYTSRIFPAHERDVKLELLNVSLCCAFKFFKIHWRVWKLICFIFCQIVRIVFEVWRVGRGERSHFMIKSHVLKKNCLYFNAGKTFVSV